MAIPEEFLNGYFLESKSENVDEFLSVRGVPWLIRKLISGKLKGFQFQLRIEGDGYSYKTCEPSKTQEYHFKLDEPFEAVGYDSKRHRITISVEGQKLKETHKNLERDSGEDSFYFFFKNGVLCSECKASKDGKTAIWRREFIQSQ